MRSTFSSALRVRWVIRGQRPTDVEWFRSLQPGWQQERILNFTQAVTGSPARGGSGGGWLDRGDVGRHAEDVGVR